MGGWCNEILIFKTTNGGKKYKKTKPKHEVGVFFILFLFGCLSQNSSLGLDSSYY
jgi:hypothetical protein